MLRRWVVAACAREWGHALDRSDFEVLQRAVLPAFAPLLRKQYYKAEIEDGEAMLADVYSLAAMAGVSMLSER